MANTVEQLLKLKPKKQKTEKVNVKLQGETFEFEIREIEPDRLADVQMANTVAIPSSVQGGPSVEGANPLNLSLDVCLEAIVEPNLKNAKLQDHFGVTTDRDLLYELFKGDTDSLGELFTKVLELSNNKEEPEPRGVNPEDVREAKN